MIRISKRWKIALGIVGALWLAGWLFFPSAWLKYKISIDVDDNGVARHGEGVIGVLIASQGPLLIGNSPQWAIGAKGEAFAVDLGERGTMFVLLTADSARGNRSNAIPPLATAGAGRGALYSYFGFVAPVSNGLFSLGKIESFAWSGARVDLPAHGLPMIVRFRDEKDPTTVERVDPDHLDASFGPGVKITAARVELTNEWITTGIEKKLPWLANESSGIRLFPFTGRPLSEVPPEHELTHHDFKWGFR